MKRIIAIVAGGDSSEHDVSMKSAEGIYSFIDKETYKVYTIELGHKGWNAILEDGSKSTVDKNDFSFMENGQKIKPDFAYITIHGTPGENGILQGYFELLGIPYSTCDVLVSALTFNKFMTNQYLKSFGIRIAESMLVHKRNGISDEEVIEKIGLPCFIKPNASGSSFGVTKVKTKEQIQPALQAAFAESDDAMIEAYMDGIELANGCYKTGVAYHGSGQQERVFRFQCQIQRTGDRNHPRTSQPRTDRTRTKAHLCHLRYSGMQRIGTCRLYHHRRRKNQLA